MDRRSEPNQSMSRLWFLLLLAVACGSPGDEAPMRADSAGVEVVTNAGIDRPLAWRFDTVFTLGGAEDGPEGFYRTSAYLVGTDAAGALYVLDPDAQRVVAFDAAGRFQRTMGGRGGGPGEFRFPLALGVSETGVVSVVDVGKRALVRFGPDGAVLEQGPWPESWHSGPIVERDSGHVVLTDPGIEGGVRGHERLIRVRGGDTTVMAAFERATSGVVQLASCGISVSGMPPVFEPRLYWVAAPAGYLGAGSAAYEVLVFDGAGALVRIIRRAVEPIAATAELAIQSLGEGMQLGTSAGPRVCDPEEVVAQRGFAPVIPAIAGVGAGPDGTIWVRRGARPDAPQPIDVFDASGAYLGTLPADAPFPVLVTRNRLAAVVTDGDDVDRLAVFALVTDD